MSTPSPEALPVGYTFGRVVARFLRAVGDSGDVDTFPEAVPGVVLGAGHSGGDLAHGIHGDSTQPLARPPSLTSP